MQRLSQGGTFSSGLILRSASSAVNPIRTRIFRPREPHVLVEALFTPVGYTIIRRQKSLKPLIVRSYLELKCACPRITLTADPVSGGVERLQILPGLRMVVLIRGDVLEVLSGRGVVGL